jgi:Tol biopolymer transport system component
MAGSVARRPDPGRVNMTRILCALAAISLGVLATGVSPALGAFPGDNGKIAFARFGDDGEPDIWTMSPDGSNQVNLTASSEGEDFGPNWRADGKKIAFTSDRETPTNPTVPDIGGPDFEIFVMDADGSNQRQITFNALDDEAPGWSPDGKRIVFERDFDPVRGQLDFDIFTMRANGAHELNLTNSPGVLDFDPEWSPDGRRIAFTSERDGDDEIYTMRPNGSGVRQLTFTDQIDGEASWSPDGRKIAFSSERDAVPETPFQVEVYTMRADGRDQTRLTFDDLSDGFPAWSPDGRQIAFSSFRDVTPGNEFNAEIFTMRADGSNQVNRTNNLALDLAPDWQPLDDHHHDDD